MLITTSTNAVIHMEGDVRGKEMNDRHTTGDNRDEPEWYAIRVKGHLDDHWQDWFDGLRIIPEENGDTLLTCRVVDQAALHGLLRKVRDLGLELLAVNRVAVDRPDQPILNEQTHSEIIRRTNCWCVCTLIQ
jgi:wyosine [tRNA(Phe)-imidazoG37] synthetase (radical SAM superfamily)